MIGMTVMTDMAGLIGMTVMIDMIGWCIMIGMGGTTCSNTSRPRVATALNGLSRPQWFGRPEATFDLPSRVHCVRPDHYWERNHLSARTDGRC